MKLSKSLLLLVLLFTGCLNTKDKEIKDKETYLSQRENELVLREQLLDMREEQLEKAGIDVKLLAPTDTTLVNKSITGLWSVEQTCTKSDCPSTSVVGDRKSEQWEIFYKENVLIAKAMDNGELVRYYVGSYGDKIIDLTFDRKEGTAEKPAAKMTITLKQNGDNRLVGQREIHRNGCIIIYSLILQKQ